MDDQTRAEIIRLHRLEHLRVGTIARRLGIHHSTVTRVLAGTQKPQEQARGRAIDEYRHFVLDVLAKHPDIKASRLYLMVKDRGYPCGPDHFRHEVAALRPQPPREAFLRLKLPPGEEAQVDWGHFGRVKVGRAERKLHGLLVVLSYSRDTHLRFFHDMETASFLAGHVSAFEEFEGVPRRILYDNLKSAVITRSATAIQFNTQLLDFAEAYGFEPVPVGVRRGNEKGRVERAVRYVRESFFAARDFVSLEQLNREAREWCLGPARERPWPGDRSFLVKEALVRDRGQLLPLPDDRPPVEREAILKVGKTPFVRFDGNDYSLPHEHVQRHVVLRATDRRVRILVEDRVVAMHRRSYDRHRQIEDPSHQQALRELKSRSRKGASLQRLQAAVPQTSQLLELYAGRGGGLGEAVRQLARLLDLYGPQSLSEGITAALEQEAPHPSSVRHIIEERRQRQHAPPARKIHLPDRPGLRDLHVKMGDLSRFDALLDEAEDCEEGAS